MDKLDSFRRVRVSIKLFKSDVDLNSRITEYQIKNPKKNTINKRLFRITRRISKKPFRI